MQNDDKIQKLNYNSGNDSGDESSEIQVNASFEDIISDNEIDIDLLPEKIQKKIATWGDMYDYLQEIADDDDKSEEVEDTVLKLNTLNDGIVSDLQPILNEIAEEEKRVAEMKIIADQEKMNQGGQTQNQDQSQAPSWRFWM